MIRKNKKGSQLVEKILMTAFSVAAGGALIVYMANVINSSKEVNLSTEEVRTIDDGAYRSIRIGEEFFNKEFKVPASDWDRPIRTSEWCIDWLGCGTTWDDYDGGEQFPVSPAIESFCRSSDILPLMEFSVVSNLSSDYHFMIMGGYGNALLVTGTDDDFLNDSIHYGLTVYSDGVARLGIITADSFGFGEISSIKINQKLKGLDIFIRE